MLIDASEGGAINEVARPDRSPIPRWNSLPLPAALVVATYFSTGQADGLLKQLQIADQNSYGLSAMGGGFSADTNVAHAAFKLWTSANGHLTAHFICAEAVFTLVWVTAVVWLVAATFKRTVEVTGRYQWPDEKQTAWYKHPLWKPHSRLGFRPLTIFALSTVGVLLARIAAYHWGANEVWVWTAYLLEKVEWGAGLIVVVLVISAVRDAITKPDDAASLGRVAESSDALTRGMITDQSHALTSDRSTRSADAPAAVASTADAAISTLLTARRRVRPDVLAAASNCCQAVVVLRGQVALLLVWSALLMVDVTGQVADLFRAWVSSIRPMFFGVVAIAVFAWMLWSSARRIVLNESSVKAGWSDTDKSTRSFRVVFVVGAVVAVVLAFAMRSAMPLGLAAALAIPLLLDLMRRLTDWEVFQSRADVTRQRTSAAAQAPQDGQKSAYLRVGRMLAMGALLVPALALVRAGAGPLTLLLAGSGKVYAPPSWLVAVGLALLVVAACGVPAWLKMIDRKTDPPKARELLHFAPGAAAVVVGVCLIIWRYTLPPYIGSVAVTATAFAIFTVVFAELQRFSVLAVPTRGIAMLGFRRIPVFALVGVWFLVAGLTPDGGYHQVRTVDRSKDPVKAVAVGNLFDQWVEANCVDTATGPTPLVISAAEGGGIRAAYWTASVLTKLEGSGTVKGCAGADALSRVFAISGISGGSVGAAAFLAHRRSLSSDQNPSPADTEWYDSALGGPDYVSTPLAYGLLVDLPRGLLGFHDFFGERIPDRAAELEVAWQKHMSYLGQDYLKYLKPGNYKFTSADTAKRWTPLTLFNGSEVENGCRVNTSAVALAAPPAREGCTDTNLRGSTVTVNDATGKAVVPAAALTVDSIDRLAECSVSIPVSTAALLSARWPYISPSGQLPCGSDPRISVVDGGYADGDGSQGALELYQQVEPLVAAHNKADPKHQIVPFFAVIDNHYQSAAGPVHYSPTGELLVPPVAYLHAGGTQGTDRRQQIVSAFAPWPASLGRRCAAPRQRTKLAASCSRPPRALACPRR